MRTTVRLDDELMKAAKHYALEHNQTLTSLIEEALREKLARQGQDTPRPPFKLITAKGKLRPGVDLDDNSALLDLMEDGLDVASRR